MSVKRPDTTFDATSHTYEIDGTEVLGVSTVAKIGDEDVWGIASAWGFRIGYEGACEVLREPGPSAWFEPEELRAELKRRGLTPWSKRDKAADRGTWVHDMLERLAQDGTIPNLEEFPESNRGYVRAVLRWYLDYRPEFVATEVQVASEEHGFAGRYDIRCSIDHDALGFSTFGAALSPDNTRGLCLIDLKTSKGVYPTTHFPQLAGYELASVEMGFPKTDAQYVLNAKEDGTYDFVRSYATAEHFLAYLAAERAKRDLKAKDPASLRQREMEHLLVRDLEKRGPTFAHQLAEGYDDYDAKGVAVVLSRLRKAGLVEQVGKRWVIR